ncbi:HNH endonuclease signature motif containing protein, partial [Gordonia sp. VNQ95]|uniref:HNH endonuclease n=1 Tax=Gordonia sp. VNQ95 TaxID=3156619 RepID=UPI0032B4E71E
GQMRADALEVILDTAARAAAGEHSDDGPRMPTELVNLTIPTGTPSLASLQFMGSVTEATARKLCCDATVGVMIVSKDEVPLSLGRTIRLFNRAQRRALAHRDKGCIKCGAPPSRTQAHHIAHWIDGGETCLENGALLCSSCHDDVHHNGWDVIMGADHHPWLIPPESVDPQRRWLRSYHRRTMTLDGLPGAA